MHARMTQALAVMALGQFFILTAARAGSEAAGDVPRYRFEVGQQLNYEASRKSEGEGSTNKYSDRWRITVICRNDDGSHRVVLRSASTNSYTRSGEAEPNEPEKIRYAWADVDSAGNITELSKSFGYHMFPNQVLPKLPANAAEKASGWESPSKFDGVCRAHARPVDNDDKFVFEVSEEGLLNEIYGCESKNVVYFDNQRGLVDRIESSGKQTYGFNSQSSGQAKLVDVQMIDAAECAKLAEDSQHFFTAQQEFRKRTEARDATAESLDEAVERLKAARKSLQSPELQEQVDRLIEEFEGYREYTLRRIEERRELIGQPAFEFSTTDLDDKPISLTDFRGKVVLLDFWYRGCGWCVRAMPQLKEVAVHYAGQPVALVGMNTDQNVEDAQFVVAKLGLPYTNLKAEGINGEFKAHVFPTLIVIDQEGKIRDIHDGWSPNLKEELIAEIDELLKQGH